MSARPMSARDRGSAARRRLALSVSAVTLGLITITSPRTADAKPPIRDAFFNVYPEALGTAIDGVPSNSPHCGVCHYDFDGGGTRNPYGQLLEGELPNWSNNQKEQAVMAIQNMDPDGDGFSTLQEVTDVATFANTPTFPGLNAANVSLTSHVTQSDITGSLVPSTGGDTTPPSVTVLAPSGGSMLTANAATTIQWVATDASGIAGIRLYLSLDGGSTFDVLLPGLANTGSFTWYPANRPTGGAVIRVEAIDGESNEGSGDSAVFSIVSPPGGLAPTTLRDFDQPGSQPFEAGILNPPEACVFCHGDYDPDVEPYYNWRGTMMSLASIDPIFEANMAIANQDAPDSGDLCLRCHIPRGWLQGRSVPTDGSQMLPEDKSGVACDFCHRLVDPIYDPAENPYEDEEILEDLSFPASNFGNGMATIDPTGARRGPFVDATSGHPVLVSPFHREAALCGTCHNVSNPVFERQPDGTYLPNTFDAEGTDFAAHVLGPVERTYSEWFYSAYNTPEGIFAPQFGGNADFVGSCQDCHMHDVTGQAASFGSPPVRDDLPLHDMTGGSTWMPTVIAGEYPDLVDAAAIATGIGRARYMLQNAATIAATQADGDLVVTVTNETGHKLPTGYPEGRRIWLGVTFLDDEANVVAESGVWDPVTGDLIHDAALKIYEVKPGLDATTAPLVGVDPGPSFHFVLNNTVFKDNRIPPRGFTNAAYEQFGGAPVGATYADGQYWDETHYTVPAGAVTAEVTLYYQSTSREFVEFMRDEELVPGPAQAMYDLWVEYGKCPPEAMASTTIGVMPPCPADVDGNGSVDVGDLVDVILAWGVCPGEPEPCPDVNGDGFVDVTDLVQVILAWGPCL